MNTKKQFSDKHSGSCIHCPNRSLCLAQSLSNESDAIHKLESIIGNSRTIHKGEVIYQAGNHFKSLYAIRTGSVKIYSLNEQGDEQITSFHMSGDLIGFDAIADHEHLSFAEALETTSICEIDFAALLRLCTSVPALNLRLLQLISSEISAKKNLTMMISKMTAKARLASFLLYLSANLKLRKLADEEIKLSMTRYEIGNYISLSVETISRLLSKFQEENIIKVSGRYITNIKLDKLYEILKNNN